MKKQFEHLDLDLDKNIKIDFNLRMDQFCIDVEKKIFHTQLDLWNEETQEYIMAIPFCNTIIEDNNHYIGDDGQLNCPLCIKYLELFIQKFK
jgi:hypothetical protein